MMAQGGKRRAPREMARAVVYLEAAKEEISERDYDAARDDLTEVERSLVKVRRYIEGPPEDEKLTDIDKDGIPDYLDLCPTIPETVNGHQDDDGCPDVAY